MANRLFGVQDQCVEGQTEKLMEGTKEPRSVCMGRAEGKQCLCTTSFYHE